MSNKKQEVTLIDSDGQEWARYVGTQASIKRFIKEYSKYSIYLTEGGQ